jgi:hypothetical protein
MSFEESAPYFKRLENLDKIRCTNGLNPFSLPVNNKKSAPVTNRVKQHEKGCFEAKAGLGKKSLALLLPFEEINSLKKQMQLKPEKTTSSKNKKASILFPLY